MGFFRFTQTEAFVADSWKVNRKLSLELGVAVYQFGQPIYTQANNLANFDPSLYDPAKAVTILTNGNIDTTKAANRFNGLVRAGNGVPAEELGRRSRRRFRGRAGSADRGAARTLRRSSLFHAARRFRVFAFRRQQNFDPRWFGMYYDRIEGNLIFRRSAIRLTRRARSFRTRT